MNALCLTGYVLLLSLSSCTTAFALDDNEEITDASTSNDYLVYSVTWQPSFCVLKPATPGCATPPAAFLTHGIWPYNKSTAEKTNRHPQFCNTAPSCQAGTTCEISAEHLTAITTDPQIARLVTADPAGMFKHEWKKHGTCSGKLDTDYFQDIVKLRKVVKFKNNQREQAFNTWVGGSVDFATLKEAFPSNTSFRCFVKDDKQYLHEVFYLITADGQPYENDPTLQIGITCQQQPTFIPGA
ncbi:ribonuclease [Pseudomonas sp. SDI]|uniref:ribonuclease T2 family protein n=1 Tax=Pseudomonas sp. SDI TaxID=2170734 RepID=UPI000DE6F68F|nr:ribonuclease [Pseudomonas sp. SDI]PWB31501.1 ribonuclease [Pseudomonas sp. SDI]